MPITTTPSGGPQGEFSTYTPIYATTLSSNTVSITFSNIPTTFTDLVLVVNGKSVTAGSGANGMRSFFNNDSSSLYSETGLSGDGTSASSYRLSSTTYLNLGDLPQASAGPSANIINIMNYSSTTTNKTVITRNNTPSSGLGALVGLYRSTSPITSMTLTRDGSINIASGTTFTLYGIKAAAAQFIPTKAAGGDLVATDGTYAYHAFLNTGSFKAAQALTADVLVVAGGGAGGGSGGGGGGAGGVIAFASQSLASGSSTTCTVGAGGAGGYNQTLISGSNSQFGALTLAGYGTGGNGAAGASAGSASGSPTTFSGGTGNTSGFPCGGGGGAGGAGGNNSGQTGGAGGAGLATVTNWGSLSTALTTLGLGVNGYIAGGGGGGGGKTGGPNNGGTATAGGGNGGYGYGSGNGGGGGVGLPGTGGGGGGGGVASGTDGPGGAGGSGVIIVRYAL